MRLKWILACSLALALTLFLLWVVKPPQPSAIRDPLIPEPQDAAFSHYEGSESCRECHPQQFADWEHSTHMQAERMISPKLDAPAFSQQPTKHPPTLALNVHKTNGHFQIQRSDPGKKSPSLPVTRVIGHDPLRQFIIEMPGGRFQVMDTAFDPSKNQWFSVFGDDTRIPGDWSYWSERGMNWNSMCASCHNTRLRKNYDPREDTYRTSMAEMSVGCESCHGPMKPHAQWRRTNPKTTDIDPTIQRPTRDQSLDTCGSCHSRRQELTGDFIPGDPFHQHFRLTTLDESDLYFADGKVRDELYEYGSFLSSKMHAAGVRCTDCHDPHRATLRLPGNALCLSCHAAGIPAPGGTTRAPIIDPAAHSFHSPESAGAQCVNCHMPQTTFMQRQPRHDHSFTIPDPLLTQQTGTPNACNQCHADQDARWAQAAAERWWGEKMNRPSRTRAQLINAARKGNPDTEKPLLDFLQNEPSPYWKAALLRLLAACYPGDATLAAMQPHTAHPDPLVRTAATEGMTRIAPERHPKKLHDLLADSSRSVRIAAAWAQRTTLDTSNTVAVELLQMMEHNADQPSGQVQLSAWALARGDTATALTHMSRAAAWDANSAATHQEYATLLSILGHKADALKQMQIAERLEPQNPEILYHLALALHEAGQPAPAISALERTVKIAPSHARAWYNLALALNQQGRPLDALSAFANGEKADPQDPRIPYAAATIHAQQSQFTEARAACARALKIAPQMREALILLDSIP